MVLQFPILADYAVLTAGKRLIYATHGHVYNNAHLPPIHPGDILLHGHTHIPDCHQEEDGLWVLNPGSCGYGGGSAGLMEVENGNIISCRILRQTDLEEMQ